MVTPLPTKLCMGPDDAGPPCEDARAIPITARTLEQLVVKPGTSADLARRDTAWPSGPEFAARDELKQGSKKALAHGIEELSSGQELLWASGAYALLVVFQAIDAAGKDSTIKHVMSGVNPQGIQVVSFKQPSAEELAHDFLWRISKALPERGRIGIFNRSHYEEVIAVRVHPDWLERQKLPGAKPDKRFWAERYEDINAFERHLDRSKTKIVKFFLHVSKEEQRKRFLKRLTDPRKMWKFNADDVAERAHWDEYMAAYEDALSATSTEWAPWYVVPADHKWLMRVLVADALVETIHGLDLRWPEVSEEERRAGEEARRLLETET